MTAAAGDALSQSSAKIFGATFSANLPRRIQPRAPGKFAIRCHPSRAHRAIVPPANAWRPWASGGNGTVATVIPLVALLAQNRHKPVKTSIISKSK
jgi:hypothetical protein